MHLCIKVEMHDFFTGKKVLTVSVVFFILINGREISNCYCFLKRLNIGGDM